MMVQLNIGKNVKHLIAILLLSSFSTAYAVMPETEILEESQPPELMIIIPDTIEPEAAGKPLMNPAECRAAGQQMIKLSQVVEASDEKASGMRDRMRVVVDTMIVPLFTIQPDWAQVQVVVNQYAQVTEQYGLLIVERDKAYDARDKLLKRLITSCSYKPEGDS